MLRHLLVPVIVLSAVVGLAAEPRLRPVAAPTFTDEQRALVATYSGVFGTDSDLKTLLLHPELVKGVLPFANYILSESTLTPRHRELLIMRTAWQSRSTFLWYKHQPRLRATGFPDRDDSRLVASGKSRADIEDTLLLAADELHTKSFVSDETWRALSRSYNEHQLMDAVFTIAETTMLAGLVNSVDMERELGGFTAQVTGPQRRDADRGHQPLTKPRVEPVVLSLASPEIGAMLDPSGSGRDIAAVYRTFARHPKLYVPRQILSEYIRTKSTLSGRVREMLILRIGWRCKSAYEWAAHAPAGRRAGLTDEQVRMLARSGYDGWNAADAAIVRAADELFDDDRISEATWKALDEQFDEKQLLDVLITTGGYRMVSMVLNTFGVPAEPNSEPFP